MVDPNKTREALLEKFRQICTERINTITQAFSSVCQQPTDTGQIELLLREVHTLKGELRIMGFADGGKIVHAQEDVLKRLKEKAFENAHLFYDLLTEGLDSVAGLVLRGVKIDTASMSERILGWTPSEASKASVSRGPAPAQANESPSSSADVEPSATDTQPAPVQQDYRVSNWVRINGEKLDALGDLAGELFTSYLNLRKLSFSFDGLLASVKGLSSTLKKMGSAKQLGNVPAEQHPLLQCQQLIRRVSELRRSYFDRSSSMATSLDQVVNQVRELRMMPMATLFDLYQTAVRDVARERKKKVTVNVRGGATLVDRSVMDALGDILLHLVRNAVDHGIESPADRLAQKKTEQGTITMQASQVGDRVLLDVEDDGQGIDLQRVKQAAVQKQLVTQREADLLDDDEAMELIFLSGFSTAEKTSEISGRGVGMDVVRNRVQELGGSVRIKSTVGKGTSFTVELPTSIAINQVLLFRTGGQLFAILATFVDRVERLDPKKLMDSSGGKAMIYQGRTIPIASASNLMQLAAPESPPDRLLVMIVVHGGRAVGLLVDELLGERELAIKPIGNFLSGVRGISGATTLEDGKVVLLLHAADLITGMSRLQPRKSARSLRPQQRVYHVLLVEDSLVTRELEKSMLTSIGLVVEEASDGLEAIEKLARMECCLIISDVEMPRLDGFGLTERVKKDERFANIPVILVTTRGSAEDRQRGLQAGASAYISKNQFESKDFIEVVRRFLPA